MVKGLVNVREEDRLKRVADEGWDRFAPVSDSNKRCVRSLHSCRCILHSVPQCLVLFSQKDLFFWECVGVGLGMSAMLTSHVSQSLRMWRRTLRMVWGEDFYRKLLRPPFPGGVTIGTVGLLEFYM